MSHTREEDANRIHWNQVAPAHYTTYDLETLRNGGSVLKDVEVQELGNISGLSVLHMQCHIGTDTLSLERAGARVTGVDFSEESIRYACKLRDELGLKTRFILGNALELDSLIDEQYDVVYTGQGVLCWLRDLEVWGRNVAQAIKPGGFFYIYEYHPFAYVFDDESNLRVDMDHQPDSELASRKRAPDRLVQRT